MRDGGTAASAQARMPSAQMHTAAALPAACAAWSSNGSCSECAGTHVAGQPTVHALAAHSSCLCLRSAETYLLHCELLNTLLVLASTQLYTPNAGAAPGAHPFTEALLGAADLAPALVQARQTACVCDVPVI